LAGGRLTPEQVREIFARRTGIAGTERNKYPGTKKNRKIVLYREMF
jgi:hypothetical protein